MVNLLTFINQEIITVHKHLLLTRYGKEYGEVNLGNGNGILWKVRFTVQNIDNASIFFISARYKI